MLRQRSEVFKWIGIALVVVLAGWYLWQHTQSGDDADWLGQAIGQEGNANVGNGQGVWGKAASVGNGREGSVSRTMGAGENNGGVSSAAIVYAESGGNVPESRAVARQSSGGGQSSGMNSPTSPGRVIVVHAAGAVKQPGVYYLAEESRVVDLVKVAGGVTSTAELNEINLAEYLSDGEKVYIPYRGSNGTIVTGTSSSSSSDSGGSGVQNSSVYTQSGHTGSNGSRVNINTAALNELENLPGIGLSRAQAVIQYRNEHGRFQRIEDLKAVSGIGDKIFAQLENLITV